MRLAQKRSSNFTGGIHPGDAGCAVCGMIHRIGVAGGHSWVRTGSRRATSAARPGRSPALKLTGARRLAQHVEKGHPRDATARSRRRGSAPARAAIACCELSSRPASVNSVDRAQSHRGAAGFGTLQHLLSSGPARCRPATAATGGVGSRVAFPDGRFDVAPQLLVGHVGDVAVGLGGLGHRRDDLKDEHSATALPAGPLVQ